MELFNKPETPETEEYEKKKEKYVAKCTVCPWEFWRGADRETVELVIDGHQRLTGHFVILQGEDHYDPELPNIIYER